MFIAATSIAATTQPAHRAPRPIRQQNSITKVSTNATSTVTPFAIGSDASDYTAITDWQSIGTGRYTDGFVAWSVGDTGYEMDPWQVEIEESAANPGLYRIVNPYAGCSYATDYGEVVTTQDYYMIVDATDPDAVFIPEFETGVEPYYADYQMVSGKSQSAGTLANYEITFPAFGLACYTASGGWITSNNDSNFHIYLPGATDYSAALTQGSSCISTEATAEVTAGADIAYIRTSFALDGQDATLSDPITPTDGAASLTYPVSEEGKYTLTVSFYDNTDTQRASLSATYFRFDANDDQWKTIGMAPMTEGFAQSMFGDDYGPNTYNVTLQENIATPGFYRIVNPMDGNTNTNVTTYNYHSSDHTHYIYIHAEDPQNVYVEESPVGLDMSYGSMILASTYSSYGNVTNGIITIPASSLYMYDNQYSGYFRSDFSVIIPQEHTVTVKSNGPTYGTVAITDPATESSSVTTENTQVTVTATPAGDASFMYWTDADGNKVSTETSYTYIGTTDATFTAHFGYTLTITSTSGGSVTLSDGTSTISGGTIVAGTEITATITPDNGYNLSKVTVNGTEVTPVDNTITLTIDGNKEIQVSFTPQTYNLTITVKGNGEVESGSALDEEYYSIITGEKYTDGSQIPFGGDIVFLFKPGKEADGTEQISTVAIDGVDNSSFDFAQLQETYMYQSEDPAHDHYIVCGSFTITGNVNLSVAFTSDYAAISDILFDAANGPVEYYNIQGVKIAAEQLTPGFYIARQGNKATKILIRK